MDHGCHFQQVVPHQQKGFLKRRSILDHIYNSRAVWDNMGAWAALSVDFSNTYPTMGHELCEAVVLALQLPVGLIQFLLWTMKAPYCILWWGVYTECAP